MTQRAHELMIVREIINSRFVGMARVQLYSFKIDFVVNPIFRSAAYFLVIILKFMRTTISEIKISKIFHRKKIISFSKANCVFGHAAYKTRAMFARARFLKRGVFHANTLMHACDYLHALFRKKDMLQHL